MDGQVKNEHELRFQGQAVKLSTLTLIVILAGVIVPAAKYSFDLHDPTPAELLVAICIALFSGVVYLWILDATSVLRFRSEWVAKSVWGAAIASVLGTSVGVYRDAFSEDKYPFTGYWHIYVESSESHTLVADHQLVLSFATEAETYRGYGKVQFEKPQRSVAYDWIEVTDFQPKDKLLKVRLLNRDGTELPLTFNVSSARHGKLFISEGPQSNQYSMRLTRAL